MSKKIKLPTIEDMLKAGVHFGHQLKRQDPRMKKYVYGTEEKTHVIDIYKTEAQLEKASSFLYEVAKAGKQIVIVGTKRQASEFVKTYAKKAGVMYVTERWLGGTFTNFESVEANWKELLKLKEELKEGKYDHYTKKERLLIERKIAKLETNVGGIVGMKRFPGAVIVIDVKRERTVVREANAVKVPVIGIVDTNSDPRNINYLVPANDDSLKSIELIISAMADAIIEGYKDQEVERPAETKKTIKIKAKK